MNMTQQSLENRGWQTFTEKGQRVRGSVFWATFSCISFFVFPFFPSKLLSENINSSLCAGAVPTLARGQISLGRSLPLSSTNIRKMLRGY